MYPPRPRRGTHALAQTGQTHFVESLKEDTDGDPSWRGSWCKSSHVQYSVGRQRVGDVALKKRTLLQQMMRSFIAAERCDLEPQLASLWWSSAHSGEIEEDMTMEAQRGRHKFPFRKISRFWDTFQSGWHMARKLGRTGAESPKGWEQRRPSVQEHRRIVEIKCKLVVDKVYSVFILGSESWLST